MGKNRNILSWANSSTAAQPQLRKTSRLSSFLPDGLQFGSRSTVKQTADNKWPNTQGPKIRSTECHSGWLFILGEHTEAGEHLFPARPYVLLWYQLGLQPGLLDVEIELQQILRQTAEKNLFCLSPTSLPLVLRNINEHMPTTLKPPWCCLWRGRSEGVRKMSPTLV